MGIRCVSESLALRYSGIFSIQTGGGARDRISDGQRSSGYQSGIIVVMQLKLIPVVGSVFQRILYTEARPLRVFYSPRDGAAICLHLQQLGEVLSRCSSRALC